MDILLDKNGDIKFSAMNDFILEESVCQEVRIRLLWFLGEWRFSPEVGVPYYEDIYLKKPDKALIAGIIREEALKADKVIDVLNIIIELDNYKRIAHIGFTIVTDEESYREELTINV